MIRFSRLRNLAFALSTMTAAGALTACRQDPPTIVLHADKDAVRPGQMVVTGTATMQVSPDCADLMMTLVGDAMRPGAAVDLVRKRQDALIKALRALGVEDGDLKLSTLAIEPVYEWIGQRNVFKGYTARIVITATTRKFDQIGPMMEAGADAGVTTMSSAFRRSDLDVLKKQVREQALIAARDKARQTATTLGLELGRISGVSEASTSYLYSNAYFPRVANIQTSLDSSTANIGGELQPLTLDVTVTYDLPESA